MNQISRLILTKGEFAEVVEHADSEALRSLRVIFEEVGPELIFIVAPYPEPPMGSDFHAASRCVKCS